MTAIRLYFKLAMYIFLLLSVIPVTKFILFGLPKKYYKISPLKGSTLIPPEYAVFAAAKNIFYGIFEFISAFRIIGWLSMNMFIASRSEGKATHSFPSSVSFILSGYPISLSITTLGVSFLSPESGILTI